jgi:hypothetical protein
MTLEALVKEHNTLVHLVSENIQLREYIRRLEAAIEELHGGIEATPTGEPVREDEQVKASTGKARNQNTPAVAPEEHG